MAPLTGALLALFLFLIRNRALAEDLLLPHRARCPVARLCAPPLVLLHLFLHRLKKKRTNKDMGILPNMTPNTPPTAPQAKRSAPEKAGAEGEKSDVSLIQPAHPLI